MSSTQDAKPPPSAVDADNASADEIEKAPESVAMTDAEELDAANDKDNSDSGKLKTLMGVLKRMIGVKDMAAIRLSLPANLLEPVPNLEYWNYLDRGDIFSSIGELDDPLDRMLQALRFALTKELKFVHGKVCKPYNSILGEHFRCHWDIDGMKASSDGGIVPVQCVNKSNPSTLSTSTSKPGGLTATSSRTSRPNNSRAASTSSTATTTTNNDEAAAPKRKGLGRLLSKEKVTKPLTNAAGGGSSGAGSSKSSTKSPVLAPTAEEGDDSSSLAGTVDKLSLSDAKSTGGTSPSSGQTLAGGPRRITFLTEQVSHHPPISSFFVECKDTGVQLYGVDQLSAKFTGTAVKVFPGEHNKGIFVRLTDDSPLGKSVSGEEYQITHPTASINGLLRGSLWVAICDTLYVTCRGGERSDSKRLRAIVEYKDESWLMKAKYALEGVIYEYDSPDDADQYKAVKDVPGDKVVATFEGTWRGKITWKRKGEKEPRLLIDLDEIEPLPKTVRPLSSQEDMESRKIWQPVTKAILDKEYSAATRHKQVIEQRQREEAAERKRVGKSFTPRFFEEDISDGRPRLTQQGREAIDGERELKGYAEGQNVAETSREAAAKNAVEGGGGHGKAASTPASAAGGDDDDDDDDDGQSFRSAE
ncbi:hypothetical protein BDZ90DRAFT_229961 [Jaminaea rosea]|uniref:Oxysterol-binding protein n=1 Tax=Jaminaea rosea TaxID=1569628 RepID=A0A316V092_9BASI|nr:hypothetical protein BDZ90DRAFT_229961 [Jaminaea rosea]PWN30970.1 hypothetical protein BDZ90DRAFT_229961 [Jaminaea rosea]